MSIKGYRAWVRSYSLSQESLALYSIAKAYEWQPGINCASNPPSEMNKCGFYAYKTWRMLTLALPFPYLYPYVVLGEIEMWGKMVEHRDGVLRAEYARIVMLSQGKLNSRIYKAIASRYEVQSPPCQHSWISTGRRRAEPSYTAYIIDEDTPYSPIKIMDEYACTACGHSEWR